MKNAFLIASFLTTNLISTLASENKRVNVALNQKAHQSSTLFYNGYYWKADFALDGNAEYSDFCECCSCTSGSETPWLIIDLGSIYHIGKIVVIGRPDVGHKLRGFKLYAGETERQTNETTSLVYRNAVSENEYRDTKGRFDIAVGSVSMQFIRIYNENIKEISICEVNVYEACESGKYGTNCAGECRCLNSSACDKRTGACSDGYCLFGWKGKYCNISVIVSEGKSVKMSTQFVTWNAERAVDGNTRTDASDCDCCAGTKYTYSPWFQIDLGKLFRIAYIVIFGRTDHDNWRQSFNGLNIYATKHDRGIGERIFSFSKTRYFLNITLKTPVITRYITLKQTRKKLMVICELQLLEGGCEDGQFGRLCDKSCNCQGKICNKETGVCPSGKCLPGYWGSTCSEECADGQYGIGCNETCGHCLNGTTCDKVHGNCLSCNPGYQGQLCSASCSNGTYGLNCSSYCENCQENECDHVTGQCVRGCNPGYSGLICNTSCGYGSYGIDCSQRCGSCANNQTCNNTNGHCDTGCLEGFIEPLCITRNEELVQDENSNQMLGSTVGIPMGLAFVVLAVVIVTIVILRKRRQKRIPGKDDDVIEADNTKVKNKDDLPSIPNKDPELVQRTVTFANVALEEIEYYDFAPRKEDIKIHQIWDYIHDGMADDCKRFYKEFEGFKKGLQCECKCAKESQNKLKNRYQEVYAYDENRVCLKPSDPSEGDYINASFIDGYEKLEKFIASQGPTKEMVDDFWRMISQQRCTDIVMLTNIFELGVQKCLQYWPRNDESISFGNIAVKLLKEEKSSDFVIRNLEINHKGDETRIVKQYHFTTWPDKTTPDTAWSLINFWRIVREGTIDAKYPIVVHCSAGIGRTGTFIALDNLYNQAVTERSIRPAQMVETLRRQRTYMVQTKIINISIKTVFKMLGKQLSIRWRILSGAVCIPTRGCIRSTIIWNSLCEDRPV